MIVDEGDAFNEILHNKSINALKGMGIFKKVESQIIDGDTQNQKIINISIEEKPTGEISLQILFVVFFQFIIPTSTIQTTLYLPRYRVK